MTRFKTYLIVACCIITFAACEIIGKEDSSVEIVSNGTEICNTLLEGFANASASFTYCAIKHARPIRICEVCVQLIEDVQEAHDKILKAVDGDGNKKCKELLMNLDRLEVIERGFAYVSDLWDRASCNWCFDNVNGTLITSNSTVKFFELSNNTEACFSNHSVGVTYEKSACIDCEKMYCDMNKYYDDLKSRQENVCMDIVDTMNITRMMWNDKLRCKDTPSKPDVIYLACTCTIGVLPLFFYLGAKLFTTVLRNRLQMPKRLAEALRPSTSEDI